MIEAPVNVNSVIHYHTVLDIFGIERPNSLYSYIQCPSCSQRTMRIYKDPIGGYFYRCTHCDINCDSIQLVAAIKEVALKTALLEIGRYTNIPFKMKSVLFPAYQRGVASFISTIMHLIAQGQEALCVDRAAECSMALQQQHCWFSSDSKLIARTVNGSVAGVKRDDLAALIKLPKRMMYHRDFLVVPYCDIANRPRSLELIPANDESCLVRLPLYNQDNLDDPATEGGLCYIDSLGVNNELVIAVQGAQVAMQLRMQHLRDNMRPPAIIGWNTYSEVAFDSFRAKKLVFWSPTVDHDIFIKAMRAPDSYISFAPRVEGEWREELSSYPTNQFIRTVNDNAVPWPKAFAKHVLSMDSDLAVDFISYLELERDAIQSVMDCAENDAEARQLANLFGYADVPELREIEGKQVERNNTGWVEHIRTGGQKQITDAHIQLDEIQVASSGERFITGSVERDKQTPICFRAPYETFVKSAGQWLSDYMIANGHTPLYIAPSWYNTLYTVAQRFNPPRVKTYLDRVGFTKDEQGEQFVFPEFRIKDGQAIADKENISLQAGLPGTGMQTPSTNFELSGDMLACTPSYYAMYGALLAIVANAIAGSTSRETRGIVVFSAKTEAGAVAVKSISDALKLPESKLTSAQQLISLDKGHALPSVVHAYGANAALLYPYLFNPKPKSLLVVTDNLEAWSLLGAGGWILIDGRGEATEVDGGIIANVLFTILADLQKRGYPPTATANVQTYWQCLKTSLDGREYADAMIDGLSNVVFGDLQYGDHRKGTSTSTRCLFPLHYAAQVSNVPRIDDSRSTTVDINLTPYKKVLNRRELPTEHFDDVISIMMDAGRLTYNTNTMIRVDRAFWNLSKVQWRNMVGAITLVDHREDLAEQPIPQSAS